MYALTDYDYTLPRELIAQTPLEKRDASRLLRLNRSSMAISHHRFGDLPGLLCADDLLVVNDTRVIPGRLLGHKATGGKVEVLILNFAERKRVMDQDRPRWICTCLVKASKKATKGTVLYFEEELQAEILETGGTRHVLGFTCPGDFEDVIQRIGRVPLPPYIRRDQSQNADADDRTTYQTVYAAPQGAIAAPTAGLHFTQGLLASLRETGIQVVPLTLHVGYGTFIPVRVDDIRKHVMHAESFAISAQSAQAVNQAKAQGRRVVVVGTTAMRTLEYVADDTGRIRPVQGDCDLFIYPGYRFKCVNAMITNFHLPQSTLLMLVSAFAGRQAIKTAYQEAIREKYRFYSYGDAMLID